MDQTVTAFSGFLEAVTDQVGKMRDVRDDILYVADDTVRAVMNGQKLYTPWQQEYSKVCRAYLHDSQGEKMRISQAINDLHTKDVTIAAGPSGGIAVPKQLGDSIDTLARAVCPLLNPDILGAVEVNTSDYHQPIGIADSSAARVGETGTRTATGTATFAGLRHLLRLRHREPTRPRGHRRPAGKVSRGGIQRAGRRAAHDRHREWHRLGTGLRTDPYQPGDNDRCGLTDALAGCASVSGHGGRVRGARRCRKSAQQLQ
jgi:hypothetical protein